MNPTHCSKDFAPRRGTFDSSCREPNLPFSSRYFTMFFASVALTPDTYDSKDGDAVFKSTPTWLTADSTTAFKFSSRRFCETSCWYCPTPIAFGSIFTSSASGSCSLRAIEIALRSATSSSGNSVCASFDAEYTLAPASLTIKYLSFRSLISPISSATNCSVSRDAVPFPITISSTLYLLINCLNFAFASATLLFGGVG
ncbi:hypothetical protein D3C85_1081710 [compost metagenome]